MKFSPRNVAARPCRALGTTSRRWIGGISGGTEGDRHFLQGRLAAEEAPVLARDRERLVRGPGGHRAVHVVLEQRLQLGPAAAGPLFRARDRLAVEQDQRVGQIGSRRELRDLGEVGGRRRRRRSGTWRETRGRPAGPAKVRSASVRNSGSVRIRLSVPVRRREGRGHSTPGHHTACSLLREWDRIAIMGGPAVCPEIAGRVPVRADSHRRLEYGQPRSLRESQRRMSLTADPTASAAPAADPFADLLIDPRSPGPIRAELFGLERLEEHAPAAGGRLHAGAGGAGEQPAAPAVRRERPIPGPGPRADRRAGASATRTADSTPSGCSTTSTSSRRSSARSSRTCPAATTRSCPSSPSSRPGAIPASTPWPWPWWRTTTASSTRPRIAHYVQAFQEVAPLTIGELWAAAHDAPARPAGEPAPARRADALELGRAAACRALGGRSAGAKPGAAHGGGGESSDPDRGSARARPAAVPRPDRCRGGAALAVAPRQGAGGRRGAGPDRDPARGAGDRRQRGPPPRAPPPGGQPGLGRPTA